MESTASEYTLAIFVFSGFLPENEECLLGLSQTLMKNGDSAWRTENGISR